MATKDPFRRYLDAGTAFTQITRARSEELVGELVRSGEVQRSQAQAKVEELVERSRKSTEALLAVVRDEVASQINSLGLGSVEDVARQVASLLGRTADTVRSGSVTKSTAKKTPAKKSAAKKTPATKTTAKKAPAKKTAAKKTPAKKSAAKKTPAAKTAATKATTVPGTGGTAGTAG
jgi:polyhydroxyalkanoate synthesis regulator phasin